MDEIDIKNTMRLDTIEELLVIDKSARNQLCQMKDKFNEFSKLIKIPEGCYKIKDSYEWITLYFEMKSTMRDDLIQHYILTCLASGDCIFEVEFKTPKILTYKGKACDAETYENIVCEYSTEDVKFTYDDSSDFSDSMIWNADICLEGPMPDIGSISDAFEKLHASASNFTRDLEIEFWKTFDKSKITSFTADPFEMELDLSADYELYEGDTFIGTQAYMRIITELSGEELVINKHNDNVVLESTEYFEFADKEKTHTYRFEPSETDVYIVNEQILVDDEKEQYTVGEIRKVSDNVLCCSLADSFCSNSKGIGETVIVSYDNDAISAFATPNIHIAAIRRTEDKVDTFAFEGTTMMKCKYVVHTEQYYTRYLRLLAAIPYLAFSMEAK